MQVEVISIIFITLILIGVIMHANRQLQRYQAGLKPTGIVLLAISYVEAMLNITVPVMGKRQGQMMAGYIGSVFIYLLLSNWSGLFGLKSPTATLSVTLALAFITWVVIQATKIHTNGIKGFIAGFFQPFFFFVIPNVFSMVAPLISLSLRMFGNVVAGSMIMSMFYSFTGWLSGQVPLIGGFDFIGVLLAPMLHLYFDIFSGFLQAFLFISLTTIFIGIEQKEE